MQMQTKATAGRLYICPMHSDVRQSAPGKCRQCGMELVAEGTRFALVRHMVSSPMHLAVMGGIMLALMGAAMLMMGY